ncbi:uncharacterized protein N7482_000149 [Penicillium canariense]|uniref:Bul1 C-terminal domain-containing protein n=1 Tax=Penicillium canariense TaxID=189055 RepID=A0A9W9LSV4_9EURO|nr:uncharacterized protein N7482_000149 [Penicillium canariense]KAJ5174272.1 hypothetical protein N7482_000149 [Penicillium canariense]
MAARSIMSHGSETLDLFTCRSQPKIEIELVGQVPGLVNSYTTGDLIEGTAKITVDHETRFDKVEIMFQGTSHTAVERASCPGRTGSQHMFLKLRQPIEESEYPFPRILEAGRSYDFPFTFVVPDRLLPQVCTHARTNVHIHHAHTMLPPTLGDPMIAGNGKTLLDDMVPDMSQISYIVRAAVLKRSRTDSHNLKTLANLAKKVRIIPTVEEEPPINVVDHPVYCTRKEKNVKRGFLRGKLGRLLASAPQPKPIRLLPPSCESSDTVSTMTTVQLRFDPVDDEQPPRLGSMTSKIKASTFYSAGPWDDFPSQSSTAAFSQTGRGLFTESVPLSNMCVGSAKWVKHSASTECERRDSLQSTTSDDSTVSSASFSGDTYYTASVVVPISLPSNKTFVPTFHSCLMSRTYSLELSLTYHTPSTNVLTPTISLRLPIQVITPKYVESFKSDLGMSVTQEELDEFFQPHSGAPRSEPVVDVSLGPPGYSETVLSSRFRGVRATH